VFNTGKKGKKKKAVNQDDDHVKKEGGEKCQENRKERGLRPTWEALDQKRGKLEFDGGDFFLMKKKGEDKTSQVSN